MVPFELSCHRYRRCRYDRRTDARSVAAIHSVTKLLLLLSSLLLVVVVSIVSGENTDFGLNHTNVTICGVEGNTTCAKENRICLHDAETGNETCGNCQIGYLDLLAPQNRTCFNVLTNISWDMFVQVHEPTYRQDEYNDDEEDVAVRYQKLRSELYNVSIINAQIPPLPYKLGCTDYSADTIKDQNEIRGLYYDIPSSSPDENDFGEFDQEDVVYVGSSDVFDIDFSDSQKKNTPKIVNWVDYGAVSSVKKQGRCSCCWAIATVQAIESAVYIQSRQQHQHQQQQQQQQQQQLQQLQQLQQQQIDQQERQEGEEENNTATVLPPPLIELSFQQLISCDKDDLGAGIDHGCDGGLIPAGLMYAAFNSYGGITSHTQYPFTDRNGIETPQCLLSNQSVIAKAASTPRTVMHYRQPISRTEREKEMKAALVYQPVAITVNTKCCTWNNYLRGVVTVDEACACQDTSCIDHAVFLVGYNDTHNPPYWLIKNSWGDDWGEDGYIRVAQGQGGRWGLFGMLGAGYIPQQVFEVGTIPPNVMTDSTIDDEEEERGGGGGGGEAGETTDVGTSGTDSAAYVQNVSIVLVTLMVAFILDVEL